jgi:hypothetical protein
MKTQTILNISDGSKHFWIRARDQRITIAPGLSELSFDLFQCFEKFIRRDTDLQLIYPLPATQIERSMIPTVKSSLSVRSAAQSTSIRSDDSGLSSNTQRSALAKSRVTLIAEQFRSNHGMYPSRNQLAKLANCGRDLASRVLKQLTND